MASPDVRRWDDVTPRSLLGVLSVAAAVVVASVHRDRVVVTRVIYLVINQLFFSRTIDGLIIGLD